MTQNTTKNDKCEQCDHKTYHTENLFCGRKYLPDAVLPVHAPTSVLLLYTMLYKRSARENEALL
jgi:hypothetical protein